MKGRKVGRGTWTVFRLVGALMDGSIVEGVSGRFGVSVRMVANWSDVTSLRA
jgi:hypothetical protein